MQYLIHSIIFSALISQVKSYGRMPEYGREYSDTDNVLNTEGDRKTGANYYMYDPVAFSGSRAAGCCRGKNSVVVFERTYVNTGGGWEEKSGVFTAPIPGLYYFSWTGLANRNNHFYMSLYHNDQKTVTTNGGYGDGGHNSASGSVILSLLAGHRVFLRVTDGFLHETDGTEYTTLSGMRIGNLVDAPPVTMKKPKPYEKPKPSYGKAKPYRKH